MLLAALEAGQGDPPEAARPAPEPVPPLCLEPPEVVEERPAVPALHEDERLTRPFRDSEIYVIVRRRRAA